MSEEMGVLDKMVESIRKYEENARRTRFCIWNIKIIRDGVTIADRHFESKSGACTVSAFLASGEMNNSFDISTMTVISDTEFNVMRSHLGTRVNDLLKVKFSHIASSAINDLDE